MKRMVVAVIAAVAMLLSLGAASASARTYAVPCWEYVDNGGTFKTKPRNCILAKGQYGYHHRIIRNIRWRSWGGRTAYGRGVLRANMGFKARVKFFLYRPEQWNENLSIYRRARVQILGCIAVCTEQNWRPERFRLVS